MPRVKGVYENGVIRPLEKIDVPENGEVDIIYGDIAEEKKGGEVQKIPTFKARELKPLIGMISIGGDAVKDSERYDE